MKSDAMNVLGCYTSKSICSTAKQGCEKLSYQFAGKVIGIINVLMDFDWGTNAYYIELVMIACFTLGFSSFKRNHQQKNTLQLLQNSKKQEKKDKMVFKGHWGCLDH